MKQVLQMVLVSAVTLHNSFAQISPEQAYVKRLVNFFEIPATKADEESWVGALKIVVDTTNSKDDRNEAFKKFFTTLAYKIKKDTAGFFPRNWARNIPALTHGLRSSILESPQKRNNTPDDEFGRLERVGSGGKTILFIGDVAASGSWHYKALGRLLEKDFSMYIATIPGLGNTAPYALPDKFDPQNQQWLTNLQKATLKVIRNNKLKDVILVGVNSGAYTAVQVALLNPALVDRVILMNGLVSMPLNSAANPEQLATPAERLQRNGFNYANFVSSLIGTSTTVSTNIPPAMQQVLMNQSQYYSKDSIAYKALYEEIKALNPSTTRRYFIELGVTDLTASLAKLNRPTLIIPAIHDEKSSTKTLVAAGQWQEILARYPSLPLTIVPFYDTRASIAADAPEEAAAAIKAFSKGQPVKSKPKLIPGNRESKVQQHSFEVNKCKVVVEYGSPQVKGREVWGKLIPFDKVWRAGANEATTISFSKDVLIGGKSLKAGTYSFFLLPQSKDKMTVIFNKITHQWGTFTYHSEFDALRVEVTAHSIVAEEELSFKSKLDGKHAIVSLNWADVSIPFHVR
jgi:pimeloyl-ACP methyl ester carboxylesterase